MSKDFMKKAVHLSQSGYELTPDGRFVIKQYNDKRPFSNFLPGIAGLFGTPMWVFYVNRGQGIASFGTRNKDGAILEFFPANKAYQQVTSLGFRTFLKIFRRENVIFYEPFREAPVTAAHAPAQSMEVSSHELVIREVNEALGLEVVVKYFTVPGEPLAVLAREVSLTNRSATALDLEMLDGLPSVNPYGMNEFFMKNMSRTIEAWMTVDNLTKKAPYFHLKVDAADRPEVILIPEGNFYFGLLEERRGGRLLDPVVDPSRIFGSMLDFSQPKVFYQQTPFKAPLRQLAEGKTPCAFSLASFSLPSGHSKKIRSFFGHAKSIELLNRYVARAKRPDYFEKKRLENKQCIEGIKSRTFTATAVAAYDLYCGQTYLDNIMRGGLPIHLGGRQENHVFYVYSRKHGDLERDYNRFLVEPTYFSQGDGNYRDVNQNRRSDVWFDPRVKDSAVKTFLNLIQLDGFNPLVIKGSRYHFRRSSESRKILTHFFNRKTARLCESFLSGPFNPGEFYRLLEENGGMPPRRFNQLLEALVPFLIREDKAEHGEGFWVDHWTYNLDLIESYLAIYPEDKKKILFEKEEYTFYDNDHRVSPRHEKYFLNESGAIRQYRAVTEDKAKASLLAKRDKGAAIVRTRGGQGEIYQTSLFVKLLCLFTNKLASLDAEGIGIEMEADKPSWYDALNGLPGLLGSSLPETFELKRLTLFLIQSLEDSGLDLNETLVLPAELTEFIKKLSTELEKHFRDRNPRRNFMFWDMASAEKEKFRQRTFMGLSGKKKKIAFGELKSYLEHAREKIEMGIERAFDAKKKLYPTYFENEVVQYRILKKNQAGQVYVKPLRFKQTPLPFFLEGPVHALKVETNPAKRKELLRAVRESDLYDAKLEMYKVCAPLSGTSPEIGRARVFPPGWLENQTIWLHMEYKFLLELLKSGMTEEFFRDFKKTLVPFQPPERYGRSILENSSFIVSSANPDASLHGAGFVARLSGSTAEFLNMWLIMNIGKRPFILTPDKKLALRFEPQLPAFLFLKEDAVRTFVNEKGEEVKVKVPQDSLAFLFLGKTLVFYHNPKRLDTFGKVRVSVKKISWQTPRGQMIEFKGDTVPSPYAAKIRDEFVPRIDIELG